VRTIERDLSALGQAGVPISAYQGRLGGYVLDRSMTLPPLNFTPDEAAAVAVALSRAEQAPLAGASRSALRPSMGTRSLIGSFRAIKERCDRMVRGGDPREFSRINMEFFHLLMRLTANEPLR
jgi:hypothetical protein